MGFMKHMTITGNLTRDPELRTVPGGRSVCNFNVAVNAQERVKNPDGSSAYEKTTDYFRITVWGSTGENCAKYLKKGRNVTVHGELAHVTVARDANGNIIYQKDANGNFTNNPLINLEIEADGGKSGVVFNSGIYEEGQNAQSGSPAPEGQSAEQAQPPKPAPTAVNIPDDELPF